MISHGVLGYRLEAVGRHPHLAQPGRQAKPLRELRDGFGQVRIARQTHGDPQPRILVVRASSVEAQHRGEQNGIQGSMVQPDRFQPTKGMGQRMHGTQALLEGQSALKRRHHHLVARRRV